MTPLDKLIIRIWPAWFARKHARIMQKRQNRERERNSRRSAKGWETRRKVQ